jgi:hypothetical protein
MCLAVTSRGEVPQHVCGAEVGEEGLSRACVACASACVRVRACVCVCVRARAHARTDDTLFYAWLVRMVGEGGEEDGDEGGALPQEGDPMLVRVAQVPQHAEADALHARGRRVRAHRMQHRKDAILSQDGGDSLGRVREVLQQRERDLEVLGGRLVRAQHAERRRHAARLEQRRRVRVGTGEQAAHLERVPAVIAAAGRVAKGGDEGLHD